MFLIQRLLHLSEYFYMRERKIKDRIFIAFFIYSTLSFFVSFASFWLFREAEKLDRSATSVNNLYTETLMALRDMQRFLLYDISNPEFFRTGKCENLNEYERRIAEVRAFSTNFRKSPLFSKMGDQAADLDLIENTFNRYDTLRSNVVMLLQKRGFREFGWIGSMREHIHQIENAHELNDVLLLTLRRREKDYLLRGDSVYITQTRESIERLRSEIEKIKDERKKTLFIDELLQYSHAFEQTIKIDRQLKGLNKDGLLYELEGLASELDVQARQMNQYVEEQKRASFEQILIFMVIIVTFSIVLTLFLSVSFKFVFDKGDL